MTKDHVADREHVDVALAGNPNSGKSSLFNHLTGSREHVGNYPGVTVEKKEGFARVDNARISIVDLPGTYSLNPFTLEEAVARKELVSDTYDAIIVVVDTSRLERNLYFVSQVIETGKPVVLALNMYDEFEQSGDSLDVDQLSRILGVPCIPTVGSEGKGATEVLLAVLKAARREIDAVGKPPRYSHEMEHAIENCRSLVVGKTPFNDRWTAVNVLMFGRHFFDGGPSDVLDDAVFEQVTDIKSRLEQLEGRTIHDIVTSDRWGYASGAVAECLKKGGGEPATTTEKIDRVVTHRYLGFPLFLAVLWIMFQSTFTLGEIPLHWIETFFSWLASSVEATLPPGFFTSLLVDGVISGVGGVLVFVPNIAVLFIFIALLEDTGYMARAAFIMDKVMHFFGMHGKSFLPMLIGFGCTVPAILATRILENRRDRLITMFIVPFMSCGARLPVYILLAGAFFSPQMAGNVIFSIYLFGIVLSLVMARLLNIAGGTASPFVMELPPYRIPTLRVLALHVWERTYMYIRKAGTVILAASVIIWFLMSYPKTEAGAHSAGEAGTTSVNLENTFAGSFGKFIEPALKPLGYDWRMGVALTAGFAAKEVIVSTLATIYSIGGDPDESLTSSSLQKALRNDPMLNPVKAYSLMLFILIYVPCVAVLGAVKREAGGWKWVALMVMYTIGLAYLVSFIFMSIASFVT